MKDKIIHYGIILFVVYVIFHISNLHEENDQNKILLQDSYNIIKKQRDVIDAQEMYINFMNGQDFAPLHQKREPYKGPI
tara:strand:+ start:68 stop:304 length:237 start_codon:yes stop_codon:yes gene_type:complete